jgi:hypothetical protein
MKVREKYETTAINIAKRGLGEMSNLGASVIMPRTVGGKL